MRGGSRVGSNYKVKQETVTKRTVFAFIFIQTAPQSLPVGEIVADRLLKTLKRDSICCSA